MRVPDSLTSIKYGPQPHGAHGAHDILNYIIMGPSPMGPMGPMIHISILIYPYIYIYANITENHKILQKSFKI